MSFCNHLFNILFSHLYWYNSALFMKQKILAILVGTLLSLFLLSGCGVDPVSGKQTFTMYSEQEEIALGEEYHPQLVAEFGEYQSPALKTYIQNIVTNLGQICHRPNLEYRVTLLDTPQVNAFAIPGGHVYVCRGILPYFNSEDELAAVMGHEIGHVCARHSIKQQTASTGLNIGLILGSFLIFGDNAQGKQAYKTGSQLASLGILSYGREQEMEADRLGIEYASRAGYTPLGMGKVTDLFIRLSGKSDPLFSILSTHPTSEIRQKQARIEVRKWQEQGISKTTFERNRYLESINGIALGEKITRNATVSYLGYLKIYQTNAGDTWNSLTNQFFPGKNPQGLAWLNGCELNEPVPERIKVGLF